MVAFQVDRCQLVAQPAFFLQLVSEEKYEDKHRYFIYGGCPYCHPTNDVKPLKESQSTDFFCSSGMHH